MNGQTSQFKYVKNLPYKVNDLNPYISSETVDFHFNKHHKGYELKLLELMNSDKYGPYFSFDMKLEDIMMKSKGNEEFKPIYNNAAQIFNHNMFWKSMRPSSNNSTPGPKGAKAIDESFGSLDEFKSTFSRKGLTCFGSGWTWLVIKNSKLDIVTTSNADFPDLDSIVLVSDVWEHAYYIDYRNRRADFLNAFLNHLINWDLLEKKL